MPLRTKDGHCVLSVIRHKIDRALHRVEVTFAVGADGECLAPARGAFALVEKRHAVLSVIPLKLPSAIVSTPGSIKT
jgi:hypothetical protein